MFHAYAQIKLIAIQIPSHKPNKLKTFCFFKSDKDFICMDEAILLLFFILSLAAWDKLTGSTPCCVFE